MTIKIYDSHTHLNDEAFYGDVGAFLARAKHYGVTELNMIGSNRLLNDRALKLASTYPGLHAVIGFHPEDLAEVTPTDWEGLKTALRRPEVVGVGEVGLDFVNGIADHRAQEAALVEQIDLANQLSLPVVIHCREALAETYRVLVEHPVKAGGVMHSFSGDAAWAEKFLDLDFDLSYSGVVSFTKATEVHEAAKVTPLERMMVETDAPYLTPVPYRGKQNEPAFTYFVVEALAKRLQRPVEEVASATLQTATNRFLKGHNGQD
ncbi:TatD family hydrolase [Limosilactobacillus fermentum]|uniref:TatD family hydrolase n=1 Tax=Limosilactobacillus fermentum TaxID=1613 RepID=UPI001E3110B9|nr:TatD family hydrolase [Limosilactobacillus fermentum]MCE0559673.1 TatD family hydrolase [Limosilactobacillus fermentum]